MEHWKTTVVEQPHDTMASLLTMINHRDKQVSFNVESHLLHEDTGADQEIAEWAARTMLVFYVDGEKYEDIYGLQKDELATRDDALHVASEQHDFFVNVWQDEGSMKINACTYLVETFVVDGGQPDAEVEIVPDGD